MNSTLIVVALVVVSVFVACYMVDKLFSRVFRNKAQHRSGMAVRVSKMYGVMGIGLCVIGVLAFFTGVNSMLLFIGGIMVFLMGAAMAAYYLTKGIFYNGESFLVSSFGRERVYHYRDIQYQRLYRVQGGSVIVELYLQNGETVSVQSTMDGVYPFLDTAFAGWCAQTGRDPESCDFHAPSKHWWFPHAEAT